MHNIYIHESPLTFHLQNDELSYIFAILPDGRPAQLYCGKRLRDKGSFAYLLDGALPAFAAAMAEGSGDIPAECLRLEYPEYGSSDYRQGAIELLQENGSRLTSFVYDNHRILPGKPALPGLPATYAEDPSEASTLQLELKDPVTDVRLILSYTIFSEGGALARSVSVRNEGSQTLFLDRVMSLCLDLPDYDYEWISLDGAWARERTPHVSHLTTGLQGVESIRGNSSHQHNPFLMLKRPHATEDSGEVFGFSFVYSGNFLAQVQVDSYRAARVLMGINPVWFSWKLCPGDTFQAPEAVMVYSDEGLNGMSRTFHRLYRSRLARGVWRDRPRPILVNNWEATYFDFNEEKLLKIAAKAKECGIELFVLDDGWFGARRSDRAGLGDWTPALELLPNGIKGLSEKVTAMGLRFGLWIEPEMVNPDSDLYRAHPDWILSIPGRHETLARTQCVLDFSRPEVVDHIYQMLSRLFRESQISYIKWDMNRSITECYSKALPADQQGEVFHRYILGVYDLYERLIREFPDILFESCASGGARFDPGMLYYAPQAWTSDDTDAYERLKIQYGTSYAYPLSSMGSHVSAVPNHQTGRQISLKTRADAAFFGTYGYELDLGLLSEKEQDEVRVYTEFMKQHRQLLQFGTFYRLASPFEGNDTAWIVVNEDRTEAIVGWYHALFRTNAPGRSLKLKGLDPALTYQILSCQSGTPGAYHGDELMQIGLFSELDRPALERFVHPIGDFTSEVYVLKAAR